MLTSIIILTLNNLEKTIKCLTSIRQYTPQPYELILVDNGSTDGTTEYLEQLPDIQLICNKENKGFAGGCNQGMHVAKGEQILLLNNDTIVSHNWLDNLLQALYISPRVGMVGPLTNASNPPGVKRPAFPRFLHEDEYHWFAQQFNRHDPSKWQAVQLLYGFCLLLKREVMDKIGGLDERFTVGTAEDNDYCYRAIQAGYTLLVAGDTLVHHDGHASFDKNGIDLRRIQAQNIWKFEQKWGMRPDQLLRPFGNVIPDGILVKGADSTVYYLDEQKRRPILDGSTFHFFKFKLTDIVDIPDHQLFKYPLGEIIDMGILTKKIPGNVLIKGRGRPQIFLTQDRRKRWIDSLKTFHFYGYEWDRVIELPQAVIDSLQHGPKISSTLEEGTLLPNKTIFNCDSRFYLSMNHVLYPVEKEYMEKLKLLNQPVIDITPQILYRFPIGRELIISW